MADAAKIALDDAQRQLAEAEADVEEKCAEAEARPPRFRGTENIGW